MRTNNRQRDRKTIQRDDEIHDKKKNSGFSTYCAYSIKEGSGEQKNNIARFLDLLRVQHKEGSIQL